MNKNFIKTILILLFISLTIPINLTAENNKIDLRNLEGQWEGTGKFLVPMTNIEMDIEGSADFKYNEDNDYLRTALVGEKFLFSYSDSGHLAQNQVNDSIYWEVWDNRGKHAFYKGKVEGNLISGSRLRNKELYSVNILIKHQDSIDFKLTVTNPDGDKTDKAVFNLWRVKN